MLPVNRRDMDERGWEECDFIFISGDAYVDHSSFAAALICRVLEDNGYRAGIIPQPDWKKTSSFTVLGRPRLGFLVGAGNMDSMVAHYTAAKRIRSDDAYSPEGKNGMRPDRATLVYVEGIRRAFKDAAFHSMKPFTQKEPAVIIGGIEASLRRFAHYDYWSDTVRRSILLDSKADILVYGMGEKPILEIARRLASGETIGSIRDARGTCVRVHGKAEDVFGDEWKDAVFLPNYKTVKEKDDASLRAYAEHFMIQKQNADPLSAKPLAEENDGDRWVIQNPPALPLSTEEMDRIYELPFTRRAHPMYEAQGGVPALKEVSFSLVSGRGCFGGCSFCALNFHQGRAVTGRSKESLLREARKMTAQIKREEFCREGIRRNAKGSGEFKGYIHDVGGPTANFFRPACEKQKRGGFCAQRDCLYPSPCPKLKADHGEYLKTLKALREIPGIKKVFIRSGIRFDYIQYDKKHGSEFLETLCAHHVSGQLKTAPEHISANVLEAMGKYSGASGRCGYEQFRKDFTAVNKRLGLKQYLLPYFISAHPGAGMKEAQELSRYLKKTGFTPEQTQDFYPTPGTMSTVMYYTGLDPRNMKPIYIARGEKERRMQRALISVR
ncbi:MAG: YgiQ family radical SAM protein [Treponema sp.]|nr:YgiQ family radical SAM protein [Treponema sp.]